MSDLVPWRTAPERPRVHAGTVRADRLRVRADYPVTGVAIVLLALQAAFGVPLKDDGMIGPITVQAVAGAMDAAPGHLVDADGIARRCYYYRLADQRPASRKFARARDGGKGGWIVRAEEFISDRFHFTRVQHDRRVAAWG